MGLLFYLFKNAFSNRRRTILTGMSIAVSMGLVVLLQTILLEITKPAALDESIPRMVVRHRTSLAMSLPRPYEDKIRRVPGVAAVTPMNWYGGIWKDTEFENFFARFAVNPEEFFDVFIDYKTQTPEQLEAFQRERRGCVIGDKLVTRYGFKVGDTINIMGDIYPQDIELKVVGIFTGPQADFLVFQMKYLDELMGGTVRAGTFFLLADDPKRVDMLTADLEKAFRNAESEVKVETEKAFQLSFVEMLGNIKVFINGLVSVVMIAVLMIAASTMALTIRERTREIATLKAIGFTRAQVLALVVGEGIIVSGVGGLLGLVGSWLFLPSPKAFLAVAAGVVVMGVVGLPLMLLSVLLPQRNSPRRFWRFLAWTREWIEDVGPKCSLVTGAFVMLMLLHMLPATLDWFTVSNGMIQNLKVRNETLMNGLGITLVLGLVSSLWPAWQASRLSVLDGLRTLE